MIALLARQNSMPRSIRKNASDIQCTIKKQAVYARIKCPLNVLFCLLIGVSFLQTPSLLAADIGRLFTTPAQRIALQKSRNSIINKKQSETQQKEQPPAPPITLQPKPVGTFYLQGIVYRADGKHTVWISSDAGLEELPKERAGKIKPDQLHYLEPNKADRHIKVGEYLDLHDE